MTTTEPEPTANRAPATTSAAEDWARQLNLPEVGLVTRIVRLNLLVTSVLDDIADTAGITPADNVVLAVLRRSPQHRSAPSRLCELLLRSSGGMSLTLDRLEAMGWITRTPDPDDRRRVVVTLTGEGLAVTTKVNDALHQWEETLDLDPDQREQTVGLVDGLLELFTQATSRPVDAARRR